MRNNNLEIVNDKYSGGGQDIFAMEVFGENYQGTFIDIGAREPINHNNSFMLEEHGWKGWALDIGDYVEQWSTQRKTPFICTDALEYDFKSAFDENKLSSPIDYLSIDIEGDGGRFKCLQKVFESEFEFKVITIEHDSYRGYEKSERTPQRKFLNGEGYILVVQDDDCEDWWINPKYIKEEQYKKFISVEYRAFGLFKHINLDFQRYYK